MITQEDLDKIRKAKSQIVEGSLTIWNARLDALMRAADTKGVINHLMTPGEASWGDACSCNDCDCGGSEIREGLIGTIRQAGRK